MKAYLIVVLFFSLCAGAYCQPFQTKNTVSGSIGTVIMDRSGSMPRQTSRYSIGYSRRVGVKRLRLDSELSYMSRSKTAYFSLADLTYQDEYVQRVSIDLVPSFLLLHRSRHLLVLGAGASLYFERNGITTDVTIAPNTGPGQRPSDMEIGRRFESYVNAALIIQGGYEFAATPHLVIGLKASMIGNLLKPNYIGLFAGRIHTISLKAGYSF
jgi:hypothetical protein